MQAQLQPWCDQQGITTTLRLIGLDAIGHPPQLPASFLDALPGVAWLLHGDTVRANSLLAHNSCFAVQRNICATQQLLAALPASGLPLVLISSHLAHARTGIAGATLAAAEQLSSWLPNGQPSGHVARCRSGGCPLFLILPPASAVMNIPIRPGSVKALPNSFCSSLLPVAPFSV